MHFLEDSSARARLLRAAESGDRRRALLADPGLAVSGLDDEEFTDQEVRDLKRSVLLARRLKEVDADSEESLTNRLSMLAMSLALCLLFLLPSGLTQVPEAVPAGSSSGDRLTLGTMTHSSVETLGLPGARIYELADENFSLILVVDDSFEL
jgi:hypothetical protein